MLIRACVAATLVFFVSLPAFAEQCATLEAASKMIKASNAEFDASRAQRAAAAEAFRTQMNEKGAVLGWSEERKSAVFRELKATERFVSLEKKRTKLMQDRLPLKELQTIPTVEELARICAQVQSNLTLHRQMELVRKEQHEVMRKYLEDKKK